MSYGLNSLMFTIIPIIITIGFILIFGMIIFTFINSARQKHQDDISPVLTVPASMVTKRSDVRQSATHTSTNHLNHIHTYRRYYATFQVESGDRMELELKENVYGLLAEGDYGKLTFQGKRFINFERDLKG